MKQRIICKTLAVAVILLFFGLGVQPAIAITPNTTESEDDCDICPAIKKIKSLEEKNKNNMLSNIVDEHLEEYSNLKDDKNVGDFRPICAILNMILKTFYIRLNIFLVFLYRPIILFLYYIVFHIGFVNLYFYSLMFRMNFFYDIAVALNCDIYY